MKISRRELRQLIVEMSGYRYKKYSPGAMGYSDLTPIRGDHLGRAEAGEYRPRYQMPERGMRPSHNGYLALQVMKLPREQYETMLGELEAQHGDIHSWDANAKIIYFRDGHQEKLA